MTPQQRPGIRPPTPKPGIWTPEREDSKNEDLDIIIDVMKKGQKRVRDLIKIITDTDQNRNNQVNSPIDVICAAELNAAINTMENVQK